MSYTNGPLYRPDEWRDLRPDPIPPSRRNYTPAPPRIGLERAVKIPNPNPDTLDLAVPAEQADASRARGREIATQHLRLAGMHPHSVAARVFSVLAAAEDWLSAHEIYRILKQQGRCFPVAGCVGIHGAGSVRNALVKYLSDGRIWTDQAERTTQARGPKKVTVYRLGARAAEEAREARS